MEKVKQSDWISVQDELPDIDQPCLIFFGYDYCEVYQRIETGRRSMVNNIDWCWYGYLHNSMYTDVTHWMPLPPDPTK